MASRHINRKYQPKQIVMQSYTLCEGIVSGTQHSAIRPLIHKEIDRIEKMMKNEMGM